MCHLQLERSAVITEGLGSAEMGHLVGNGEVKNAWKYCSAKYKRNSLIFVRFGTECIIERTYIMRYINHFAPALSSFLRLNKMEVLCIFTGLNYSLSRLISNLKFPSLV